jgi:hypothetical protein
MSSEPMMNSPATGAFETKRSAVSSIAVAIMAGG